MDWIFGIVIGVAFLLVVAGKASRRRRWERLMAKYGDETVVQKIVAGTIWQGMTAEQLVDAWGAPAAVDDRVLKTKVAQTYKYAQSGRNRYRKRVKLEAGLVVGWDVK